MALAKRREWRTAQRAVDAEIPRKEEHVVAEGPGAFLFSGGATAMWVEAWIAVTENRITWALPNSPRAGTATVSFDQVVKFLDVEPGVVALTSRDPEYAAMLHDSSNPHGETDTVFRLDGFPNEAALRGMIADGVERRGKAVPGSISDYL